MSARAILAVTAVLAMASCGAADAPTAPGAPAAQQGIPAQPPSIRGAVTVVREGRRVRVEENPAEETSAKAEVRITDETKVLDRDGRPMAEAPLSVGMRVRVWFSGPVAESFPIQATAAVLVIDSAP